MMDLLAWLRPAAAPAPLAPPVVMGPSCPVSPAAESLIIQCEISSESYYAARAARPTWPGGASGVTIGIGYDLGYVSSAGFRVSWGALLPAADLDALAAVCVLKGALAAGVVAHVASITIPLKAARAVFDGDTLPHTAITTRHVFQNCDALPPDCFGALVSLVYNRGASMGVPGQANDSRLEMRQIRDAMAAKNYAAVPGAIRSMKRLWTNGLVARREAEATLFEKGLHA